MLKAETPLRQKSLYSLCPTGKSVWCFFSPQTMNAYLLKPTIKKPPTQWVAILFLRHTFSMKKALFSETNQGFHDESVDYTAAQSFLPPSYWWSLFTFTNTASGSYYQAVFFTVHQGLLVRLACLPWILFHMLFRKHHHKMSGVLPTLPQIGGRE